MTYDWRSRLGIKRIPHHAKDTDQHGKLAPKLTPPQFDIELMYLYNKHRYQEEVRQWKNNGGG